MTYLGYYDPDKKKSIEVKVADACLQYIRKYQAMPAVALVNIDQYPDIQVAPDGLLIRGVRHVAANTIFVGEEFHDA